MVGEEEIQVPAGKFAALKVRARFGDEEGAAGEWLAWHADGVGEVRSAFTVTDRNRPPQTFTRMLKRFTRGN